MTIFEKRFDDINDALEYYKNMISDGYGRISDDITDMTLNTYDESGYQYRLSWRNAIGKAIYTRSEAAITILSHEQEEVDGDGNPVEDQHEE